MSQRLVFRFAVAISAVVHLAGIALAAWTSRSISATAHFAGSKQVIRLTLSVAQPQWTPDVEIKPGPLEPWVEIEPAEARIARTHYVQSSAERLVREPVPTDTNGKVVPSSQDRALVTEPSSPTIEHDDLAPQTRDRATTINPRGAALRAEPSTNWGDSPEIPPDLSRNPVPNYPAIAIQRRWQGTVLLRIWIDETGQVTDVVIERSSGHAVLDGAAVSAIRRWKALPARRGGQAVATVELLPVRFKL